MLGVEEAEGGHHRHSHGPGKEKRPEGKRRGRPEEGNEHVPPRAERPVALHGHHLAAPEGGHQLERDGGAAARHEAHAIAVATNPSLELPGLFFGDHNVCSPSRAAGEEAAREIPVAHMRARRDEAAPDPLDALGAHDPLHERGEPRHGLTIRRDQIAEAHREIRERPDGQGGQPRPRGPRHAGQGLLDDGPLPRHEPRREPPELAGQRESDGAGQPAERRREPVQVRPIVGVGVPARPAGRAVEARQRDRHT